MSIRIPSRATFEDVIAAIRTADLPPRRREDMVSAVRTVARILGKDPSQIEADPRRLALRLSDVSAQAVNLSAGRWNNIRSLVRAALALVRPMMKGRSDRPVSPAWTQLHEALGARDRQVRLSRLLRWLSERRLEPQTVTGEDLLLFRAELISDSLVRNPDANWRAVAREWNRAAAVVDGWPQVILELPSQQNTFSLPWSAFPASLRQDVDDWLQRLAGSVFDEDGPLRPARPSTLKTREHQLRAFASALVHKGIKPDELRSLADLVTAHNYSEGLQFYFARNGGRKTSAIHEMATMLKGVARHWVKLDGNALQKMGALARRLAPEQSGMTQKNRERLRALEDEAALTKLLTLPWRLMGEAESGRLKPRQAALKAQYAVAIEILLFVPIRRQNLASLEISRHLIQYGDRMHLIVSQQEVKNRVDLEFEIAPESASLIDLYREKHRPVLCGADCIALFPGRGGAAKAGATLGGQISDVILKYTGLKFSPHLFRHAGGKLYLDQNPGGYEAVRRVLGHKSLETTTKFYLGQETRSSARHFDGVIRALREAHVVNAGRARLWRPPAVAQQHRNKRRRRS